MSQQRNASSATKEGNKQWDIGPYNSAILFIVVIFAIVCGLFCWRIFQERPQTNVIAIEVTSAADSIDSSQLLSSYRVAIDSLNTSIIRQENELNKNYDLFMKARNDDADMLKMISIISAFLVALFTILGIKSLKDLKSTIKEDVKIEAKEVAQLTAQETARTSLKSEVDEQLTMSISNNDILRTMKTEIYDEINNNKLINITEDINVLHEKLSTLEENLSNNSGDGNDSIEIMDDASSAVPKLGTMPDINPIDNE